MINSVEVKGKAAEAFRKGQYLQSFEILWSLDPEGFIGFGLKEDSRNDKVDWFSHPESAPIFWHNFILREEVFGAILHLDSCDDLLHSLLSKWGNPAEEFLFRLAAAKIDTFLKAIRVNQAFIKDAYYPFLASLELPVQYSKHKSLWNFIHSKDLEFWGAIQQNLIPVAVLSPGKLLSNIVFWIESQRFTNPSKELLFHLGQVYGFIIELVLRDKGFMERNKTWSVTESSFFMEFVTEFVSFSNTPKEFDKNPIFNLLGISSNWLTFKGLVIDEYSFCPEKELVEKMGSFFLESTPLAYYQWLVDGTRYDITQFDYHLTGKDILEELLQSGRTKLPPGTEANDYSFNRLLAEMKWSSIALLSDLGINRIQVNNAFVDTPNWVGPIMAFSFNKLFRYEKALLELRTQSIDWVTAFSVLLAKMMQNSKFNNPFIALSVNEFEALFARQPDIQDPKQGAAYLLHFGYEINSGEFNRFLNHYDPWLNPFLKIGNGVFSPAAFFGNNFWFYSMAQFGMESSSRKEKKLQTEVGEESLKDKFVLAHFKAWVPGKSEFKGDVDLAVEDADHLILIQIKRPYFRLSLKDQYFERKIDAKAASQLNMASIGLPVNGKKVIKWIVSSSFERINQKIEGCLKVNFFELQAILKRPNVRKLATLIDEVSKDLFIRRFSEATFNIQLPEELRKPLVDSGLPIPLFGSLEYRQHLFALAPEEYQTYLDLYNSGLAADRSGDKIGAIKLFQQCLEEQSDDEDVWAALANTLCDIGAYKEGINAFEQAMSLKPNEPLLIHNYGVALLEIGQVVNGIKVLLDLYSAFPILASLKIEISHLFLEYSKTGVLSDIVLKELQNKFGKI